MTIEGVTMLLLLLAGVVLTPREVMKSDTKFATALAAFFFFWLPLIVACYKVFVAKS